MSAVAPQSPFLGFRYADLDPEQAAVAQTAATAIRGIYQRTVPAVGKHLVLVKEALPHGAFTAWAEQELGINARSARNYMQAAKWLGGKPATLAALPPTILYSLASPDAPAELVQEVLRTASNGAVFDTVDIRHKLATAHDEAIELKFAQRRSSNLTAEQLRDRKRKRCERDRAESQKIEDEKKARLEELTKTVHPLITQVATLGPVFVKQLLSVMQNWDARLILEDNLRAELSRCAPLDEHGA